MQAFTGRYVALLRARQLTSNQTAAGNLPRLENALTVGTESLPKGSDWRRDVEIHLRILHAVELRG